MHDFSTAFGLAIGLVCSLNPDLVEISALSLQVSLTATLLACLVGFPLGGLLALVQFRGRGVVLVAINALMGLPPVVVGLIIYMMLSNAGPLGWLQWLYTPEAMIAAQTVLISPIVAALTRQVLEDLNTEYAEQFASLSVPWPSHLLALVVDGRFGLLTVALAGFGRAIAEVGAVILVGGNIAHLTRVMTTAIALETSKGELALALALGMVLLAIALAVNGAASALALSSRQAAHG